MVMRSAISVCFESSQLFDKKVQKGEGEERGAALPALTAVIR